MAAKVERAETRRRKEAIKTLADLKRNTDEAQGTGTAGSSKGTPTSHLHAGAASHRAANAGHHLSRGRCPQHALNPDQRLETMRAPTPTQAGKLCRVPHARLVEWWPSRRRWSQTTPRANGYARSLSTSVTTGQPSPEINMLMRVHRKSLTTTTSKTRHQAIHARLENWRRWVIVRLHGWQVAPDVPHVPSVQAVGSPRRIGTATGGDTKDADFDGRRRSMPAEWHREAVRWVVRVN